MGDEGGDKPAAGGSRRGSDAKAAEKPQEKLGEPSAKGGLAAKRASFQAAATTDGKSDSGATPPPGEKVEKRKSLASRFGDKFGEQKEEPLPTLKPVKKRADPAAGAAADAAPAPAPAAGDGDDAAKTVKAVAKKGEELINKLTKKDSVPTITRSDSKNSKSGMARKESAQAIQPEPSAGLQRQGSARAPSDTGGSAAPGVPPPQSPAVPGQGADFAGRPRAGSQAGTVQRQGSRASMLGTTRLPAEGGEVPVQPAPSGAQLTGSRRESARLSAAGSQGAPAEPPVDATFGEVVAEAPAAPPAEQEEDEFAGVDFRLNWQMTRKELESCKEKLDKKDAECRDLKEKVNSLERETESLKQQNHTLADAHSGEDGDKLKAMNQQLRKKDDRIKQLEQQVRNKGGTAERRASKGSAHDQGGVSGTMHGEDAASARLISELRSEVAVLKRDLDDLRNTAKQLPEALQVIEHLKGQIQARDQDLHERAVALQQLQVKLTQAQEAIVSATDYGWENDIKLAQARRALMSILEHHSPERAGRKGGSNHRNRQICSPPAGPSEEELRLEQLRPQLEALAAQKAEAVQREDYAGAQQAKAEMEELAGEIARLEALVQSQLSPPPGGETGGVFLRTRGAAG